LLTTQSPHLYLTDTIYKGRAVHTASVIHAKSIIEICPIIILSKDDTLKIHKTLLHDYYFLWEKEKGSSAIALGYGSLYNHSVTPNAEFQLVYGDNEIHIIALEDIQAGDEITINYLHEKDEKYALWFDPK